MKVSRTFCDRCGCELLDDKETDDFGYYLPDLWFRLIPGSSDYGFEAGREVDLCPSCADALRDFMREKPTKEEAPMNRKPFSLFRKNSA